MSKFAVIVCDNQGCTRDHRRDSMVELMPPKGWLTLTETGTGMCDLHFCGHGCLRAYFAGYFATPTPDVIPVDRPEASISTKTNAANWNSVRQG